MFKKINFLKVNLQSHYTPPNERLSRDFRHLKGIIFENLFTFWKIRCIMCVINERMCEMSNIGNKETFAKNLSYYIEKHGKEQKELANIVGVAPSTFNAWVKGKKYPRMDKVERLARYFGIRKSDLIEERGNNPYKLTASITEGEQALLDLFRMIPEDKQEMVLQMIRVALNTK